MLLCADSCLLGGVAMCRRLFNCAERLCMSVFDCIPLIKAPSSSTCDVQVIDFYLADPIRQQWDTLLTTAETIVEGDFSKRQQVVHWVRSFPFAFLSDRDYIIARQCFERDGVLYGISKVVKFPSHDPGRTVRMDSFWSMWSCTSVPCPFGTGAFDL
jgi:hypothetical protein